MKHHSKRIIINACVLSILAGFITTAAVLDQTQAALVVGKVSAARGQNESAEEAARRNFTTHILNGTYKSVPHISSAEAEMKPFHEVDLSQVPTWSDVTALDNYFSKIRDLRFIEQDHFLRRLSWLYPDDGCFARADLERAQLTEWGLASPLKIVITGDLKVETKNSPYGYVTWWWHISQLIKVGNEFYVLDPAIEPSRPLRVREWLATMVPDPDKARVAICSPYTYTIYDDCAQPADQSDLAMQDQLGFLNSEWSRQIELGRDPKKVLGDEPPWGLATE